MAQFYGSLQGSRGEVTRLGGRSSGITAHVRGWQSGVRVVGHDEDGDVFDIFMTSGSNGSHGSKLVGRVSLVDGVPTFQTAALEYLQVGR